MSIRYAALACCLAGLAACSQDNTPPAESAYQANEPARSTEPDMTPASLEPADPSPGAAHAAGATPERPSDGSAANPAMTEAGREVDPSPATTAGAAPDNTKVNERDRNDAAPTPMDQGNNEADLKLTQQIRQAIMADGSLSFTAKNVKIITQNGKVTLRGPVNTAQERSAIEAAARKVAGAAQVDNQIEVKK
jgi:hypothetical protein